MECREVGAEVLECRSVIVHKSGRDVCVCVCAGACAGVGCAGVGCAGVGCAGECEASVCEG